MTGVQTCALPILRRSAQAGIAAARRAALLGRQPLPVLSEQRTGALRARTQCRQGDGNRPAGRRGAAFRPRDPPFRRLNAAAVLATPTAAAQACRMGVRIELPDWNSLARLDAGALPLLVTALLIAPDDYPALPPPLYSPPVP